MCALFRAKYFGIASRHEFLLNQPVVGTPALSHAIFEHSFIGARSITVVSGCKRLVLDLPAHLLHSLVGLPWAAPLGTYLVPSYLSRGRHQQANLSSRSTAFNFPVSGQLSRFIFDRQTTTALSSLARHLSSNIYSNTKWETVTLL